MRNLEPDSGRVQRRVRDALRAAGLGTGLALFIGLPTVAPADEDLAPNACAEAGLSGALHGLCTAYCQALDCDARETRASSRACARLYEHFVRRSGGLSPPCVDTDGDGVSDALDNCIDVPNPDQLDSGGEPGVGDACDCPCFSRADVLGVADDPDCPEPICRIDFLPDSLNLSLVQCSDTDSVPSALVQQFTDSEPECQLNRRSPDASVPVQGISDIQKDVCRGYILDAAEADSRLTCP